MSKKDDLLLQMQRWGKFSSHQVCKWGLDYFHIRADRDKRNFRQEGLIRKLSGFEKTMAGYKCKDAVYEYIGEVRETVSLF